MPDRPLAVAVTLVACGAAWLGARFAGFLPFLWLFLLVACLSIDPRRRLLISAGWLVVAVGVFLVSWTVALDHEASLRISLLAAAALLLFALARLSPPGGLERSVLAVCVALTALTALGQLAGGFATAKLGVGALAPSVREVAASRLDIGRAFGTASLPGHFAALLVMVLPLVVSRALERRGVLRAAWASLAVLTAVGVVATRSLAAVGIGAVLLIAVAIRTWDRRLLLALAAMVLAGLAVVAQRGDLDRLEPLRLRAENWKTATWVVGRHPLTGVGLGGVGQAGLVAPNAAENTSPFSHCTPLQLVAELGVTGLALVTLGIIGLARLIVRGLQVDPPLALAVAVVPLHNLVDFSLYSPEVVLPWSVLAGTLAWRCGWSPRRPTPQWLLVPLLAVGCLLATLNWRGEVQVARALGADGNDKAADLVAASRWQPWAVTPLLTAADVALSTTTTVPQLEAIEMALARRWWVRPVSPAWAEARARLLMTAGAVNRALPWAVEARRRAPWRTDLEQLELLCR